MTFLNPLVLLGLAAAAIPIILHLLNLRKLRTVEFSTLQFLKELQKTKIRRLKIRQLLLLILRTLLVLLIVLAFSRPTLTGTFFADAGKKAKTTAVIILDDSYSMGASDERGEYFRQAKQTATQIVDLLKDGDEAFFILLSEASTHAGTTAPTPNRNFAALRAAINERSLSSYHRTIDNALRVAARLLSGATNLNKELYVISDFQSGLFTQEPKKVSTTENFFPPETRSFLLPIGSADLHNLGIESIAIPQAILEVEKPLTLMARVRNSSAREARNHLISVFLDGARVAQKGITVRAGSTVDVEFTLVPKSSGFLAGMVELEGDDLEFDNRRHFSLHIPERTTVVLSGSSSDLYYVRLALSTRIGTGLSQLVVREIKPESFSSRLLSEANVIIMSGIQSVSVAQADILKEYLTNGGGLIYFPGTAVLIDTHNSTIASPLSLPRLAAIDKPAGSESSSFLEFERTDLRHPLFQGMFEQPSTPQARGATPQRGASLPSPQIRSALRYVPTPSSINIITLGNGAPFLVEHAVGQGKALLFAVTATTEWSDFPLQGLFVPLLHRSVSYLAQEQGKQVDVNAGEEVMMPLPGSREPLLLVKNPEGISTQILRTRVGPQNLLRFSETHIPGVYTVMEGGRVVRTFAVNIDPSESDTRRAGPEVAEELLKRFGVEGGSISWIKDPTDVQRAVLQSRFGVELWSHFLIAALVVALLEMLVARTSKNAMAAFGSLREVA